MMSNDATSDKDQLRPGVFKQTYFHGTKADLQLGDVIATGVQTNYQETGSKLQGCTSRPRVDDRLEKALLWYIS